MPDLEPTNHFETFTLSRQFGICGSRPPLIFDSELPHMKSVDFCTEKSRLINVMRFELHSFRNTLVIAANNSEN